jgi:ribosomal-protein-alanine N-acetyltransferase
MSLPAIQLRAAAAADMDAIVELDRASETAPHWPPAAYAAILTPASAAATRCLIVAHRGDVLVGYAVGLLHARDGVECVAELESVAVAADARRAGVGRALCSAVLDWCARRGATQVELEVRSASAAAITLYAGLGFVPCDRRPRYYRDPEDDALGMRLVLR